MSKGKVNKQFNRIEFENYHYYQKEYTELDVGEIEYDGFIKCKLVHAQNYSVVVPDQLLYEYKNNFLWFQPFYFNSNFFAKEDEDISGAFFMDISRGNLIRVSFRSSSYVRHYPDGSELYKCEFLGPNNVHEYATGSAVKNAKDEFFITLYHHTSEDAKNSIENSSYYYTTNWNIQGTAEIANYEYVYFTPLDKIVTDQDLYMIAMASDGEIKLLVDDGNPNIADDVLTLEVYRESTENRTHTIKHLINSTILAPQHLYLHVQRNRGEYYEIVNPFIHRVGINPGKFLGFSRFKKIDNQSAVKFFDYLIIGQATNYDGLKAPYDEENTESIFKIERTEQNSNMLEFWFENSNQDLFSKKPVELVEFKNRE